MNDYYKPITAGEVSYPWEAEFDRSTLGFANRDEHNTLGSVTTPNNLLTVGEPWKPHYDITLSGSDSVEMATSLQIPSICVFTIEPVFAAVLPKQIGGETVYEERLDEDLWSTLWRDLNYINRVYNVQFESIDLQFAQCALEEIVTHIANLFRAMDISQITDNPNNLVLRRKNLLRVHGFSGGIGSDPDAEWGAGFRELVSFVNQQIIGKLNQYWWCWDFIPGMWRRAAFCSRILMDAYDEHDYATLYSIMPEMFFKPTMNLENSTYVMEREAIPTDLWSYARKIEDALNFLVNDQSFIYIQTAMQAIMEKGKELADGVKLTKQTFDYYPYYGRPVNIQYQPGVLVALHNATILGPHVTVSDVEEIIGQGDEANKLIQTFKMTDYSGTNTPEQHATRAILRSKQPFNMPNTWTPDDWQLMVAAAQWKVMSYPEQPDSETYLSPKVLGTDVIHRAFMYTFSSREANPGGVEIPGFIWFNGDFAVGTDENKAKIIALSNIAQSQFFPLVPALTSSGSFESGKLTHLGYFTDIQHISFVDFRTLQPVKEQFYRNYIGYPLQLSKTGEFLGMKALAQVVSGKGGESDKSVSSTGASSGTPSRKDRKRAEDE